MQTSPEPARMCRAASDQRQGFGEAGALASGLRIRLRLSVDPIRDVVTAVRFEPRGCGPSQECYSALAELIVGRTPREAQRLTQRELATVIESRAKQTLYYSVLVHEALYAAAGDCLGERDGINPASDPVTCRCFAVRESVIRRAVCMNRLTSVIEVTRCTNAGGSCGSCAANVQEVVSRVRAEVASEGRVDFGEELPAEAVWPRASEAACAEDGHAVARESAI